MSSQGFRSSIGATTGCAYAGPWRSVCDRVDALPRSIDVVFVVGLSLVCIVGRLAGAWRSR